MGKKTDPDDPLEHMMTAMLTGFSKTSEAIRDLRDKQNKLEMRQQEHSRAAYTAMTGSGKSRYVSALVEIEKKDDPRGAQARVAEILNLSPARITQLVKSDKNRANGK